MLQTVIITTALILTSLLSFGQNFEKQFKDFSSKGDTTGQAKVLMAWEAAFPKDPEVFIAYFNYYVRKSKAEVLSLDKDRKSQSIVLADTATGEPVAYLNSSLTYHPEVVQRGFNYINQGLSLYPNRLDMRFGKIYMLGQVENYPEFAKEIIATIDYGYKINHAWLWKEGKPLEDPKQFFLSALQDYITTLYKTEDDNLLPLMRQISETVTSYYPDHVESLSNIALTYLVTGAYDKAIPYLLKAEQVAPKDVIILNNLAETFKRTGDKARAKTYYEKIIIFGNKEDVTEAKQRMKNL